MLSQPKLSICGVTHTGAVKLWDFPSGQHETTFTNQVDSVSAVVFSPDGRMLASTSYDGTVRLRDLFAHREVATLRGHVGGVWSAAFSPDGRRLATGGPDASDAVKLWDLATQRELLTLQGEGEFFQHVAFSPDGSTLMPRLSPASPTSGTRRRGRKSKRRRKDTWRPEFLHERTAPERCSGFPGSARASHAVVGALADHMRCAVAPLLSECPGARTDRSFSLGG
jgi:hypothetical protein